MSAPTDLAGNRATTCSYLLAAHVFGVDEPARPADGAGWHDCELEGTTVGWRFTRVGLHVCCLAGEAMAH